MSAAYVGQILSCDVFQVSHAIAAAELTQLV